MSPLRYALRQLIKARSFTITILLTLSLGIGACVAIFSVVNSVLLRPLPYPESDKLVVVAETKLPELPTFAVAPAQFFDWQRRANSFESLASMTMASYNLTGTGEPVRTLAAQVSANLLSTLRVAPALGRDFIAGEDALGKENVTILSHGFWLRHFAQRADILGQTIELDGRRFTIVGVMPPFFQGPAPVDFYVPAAYPPEGATARGWHVIGLVIGRLKPGVTHRQAAGELANISGDLARQFPETNAGWATKVTPLLESVVGSTRQILIAFLGAVAFLLLIACANSANLLLTRAIERSREMAVRAALGATRSRIVRFLLVESVLLIVGAAVLGGIWGRWGLELLIDHAPAGTPRLDEIHMDNKVLLFTCAIALLTCVVFGLLPALGATRMDLMRVLRQGGRGTTAGGTRNVLRSALVIAEVAIAFVLLVGAGLFFRTFTNLQRVNPGFNAEGALAVSMTLARDRYGSPAESASFARRVAEALRAIPGVQAAGGSQVLPLSPGNFFFAFQIGDRPRSEALLVTTYYAVTPEYFQAAGIPLLKGRAFDGRDGASSARVAIVNKAMVDKFFPGEDPIGKRINLSNDAPEVWSEIVGVVGDVKAGGLRSPPAVQTYQPFEQQPQEMINMVVRAPSVTPGLIEAARNAIVAVDSKQAITSIQPLTRLVGAGSSTERLGAFLFSIFSALALLLAVTGIYGVMAYSLVQRRAEIGLRMALGCEPAAILRLVLAQGGRLLAIGLAVGVLGALLVTRAIESILFGVGPMDAKVFVGVAAVFVIAGGVACLIPASRAVRTSPMIALRANSE